MKSPAVTWARDRTLWSLWKVMVTLPPFFCLSVLTHVAPRDSPTACSLMQSPPASESVVFMSAQTMVAQLIGVWNCLATRRRLLLARSSGCTLHYMRRVSLYYEFFFVSLVQSTTYSIHKISDPRKQRNTLN